MTTLQQLLDDYEKAQGMIRSIIGEAPLTWVPGLTIAALEAAKARQAFSETGLSRTAKRVEESS